ncbi:MAG: hypothetical protein ACD_57C00224G0005, partial [uncultured bacterium]
LENPGIIDSSDTLIRIFPEKFIYLRETLMQKVKPQSAEKSIQHVEKVEWSNDFKWEGKKFVFGQLGEIVMTSDTKIKLFEALTNARGNWVKVSELVKVTGADEKSYVRPTIGQIEKGMKPELRKYISIPSTRDDDLSPKPESGAYRIRYQPKSL